MFTDLQNATLEADLYNIIEGRLFLHAVINYESTCYAHRIIIIAKNTKFVGCHADLSNLCNTN